MPVSPCDFLAQATVPRSDVTTDMLGVAAVAALEFSPILLSALAGVVAMVVTGVLEPNELYDAVEWAIIFLLAGVIPLGIALEDSGGAALLAFAFVLAVTFAASTAFLGPIGYQTNLFVYGPDGYRFGDYARIGAPLQVVLSVVTVLGIAVFWGCDRTRRPS